jgi:DNA-binding transcriptional LysR family regulator
MLLAVARTGGVLAAADELGVSPSAVSQQLGKLEREAGHALVTRTPRGTVLTPAGLAVAEAAEEIERALNVARARIEGGSELAGTIRIGGFTSFLGTVLVPRLPGWAQQYPQLRVEVVEDDYPVLMRLLRRREVDAVVVELDTSEEHRRELPAGMSEEPLLDEPWKLVVPTGSLLSTEHVDLTRLPLPWLGLDSTAASATVVGRLRATSSHAGPVHHYQATSTALALVAAGQGAAVLPALALNEVVPDGVDVLDVPGLGTRRIVLRRLDRGRTLSTPADTVARLVRESVARFDLDGAVSG